LLIWAALRFKEVGAAAAIFLITAIGVIGTVKGSVPLGGASETESVQILQGLLAVVAISVYVLAATLHERDQAKERLRFVAANLAEAQALAHVGSWEWDIPNDNVEWSDEMYRIYGYQPGEFPVTFEKAMERVAPEDRERIRGNLEQAFETDGVGALVDYRIEHPDGPRILRGKGFAEFGSDGKPVRMFGTVQDVTEQIEIERQMQRLHVAEARHAQALQLNDTIVQGLAAAKAALDLDLPDREREYIEATLVRARQMVGDLLGDGEAGPHPGTFVRDEPARVADETTRRNNKMTHS
jgi:PAS domain-containing protein